MAKQIGKIAEHTGIAYEETAMPDYEDVYWQTNYLKCNRQKLGDKLAQLMGREFAGQVCTLAQQPGPLHVCLSRAYHDFNTSLVIAKFLSLAQQNWPSMAQKSLSTCFVR